MKKVPTLIQTGQTLCYDSKGLQVACAKTGQDADFKVGIPWPSIRFDAKGDLVEDHLTGLVWTKNANLANFPLTWHESLNFIKAMSAEKAFGFDDWRLPNRRELRSLMCYQSKNPSLPAGHPFTDVFLGWYWTSTTASINHLYAWYVHMEGARMFYGRKDQYYLLWPVRGAGNNNLPVTGQTTCYDSSGAIIDPTGTGQDGEMQIGRKWPSPRFIDMNEYVFDSLTSLFWLKNANITGEPVDWEEALTAVNILNSQRVGSVGNWRLPNINELESLVDCSTHEPALPIGHPFLGTKDTYWSSTTSYFEPDWAWALYLNKGAIGVGHKSGKNFHVWAVAIP